MNLIAQWVEAPEQDTLRLADVLNSGLHDELHEDEIEDLRLHGKILKKSEVRSAVPFAARRDGSSPSAAVADAWFRQNYPKLKPEDLAEHYRQHQLDQVTPVVFSPLVSGNVHSFENYRQLIQKRVINSNVPVAEIGHGKAHPAPQVPAPAASAPAASQPFDPESFEPDLAADSVIANASDVRPDLRLPPQLQLTPELMARHRPRVPRQRTANLPRTSMIALLTCFALILGGFVGLGLAHPERVLGLISSNAVTALPDPVTSSLRQ